MLLLGLFLREARWCPHSSGTFPSCLSPHLGILAQCSLIPSLSWGDVWTYRAPSTGPLEKIQEGSAETRVAGPSPAGSPTHNSVLSWVCSPVSRWWDEEQVGWSGELGSEEETLSDRHHIWGPGQLPPGVLSWGGRREPPAQRNQEEPTSVLPGALGLRRSSRSPQAPCASSDCCNTGL